MKILAKDKQPRATLAKKGSGSVVENPADSFKTWLWVSAFFSFTLLFFGPAYIYFTNSLEFNVSFGEILPWLLGGAVVLGLVPVLVLRALPARGRQIGVALLLVLGVLLWLQGNLMVWDYGPLDGREIHWNQMWLKGVLDAGVWVLLLFLAIKKSSWLVKMARTVALAVLVMQLINVAMAVIRAPKTPSFKRYYLDESEKFQFSSRKNVIVLMLDTFQTDLFQEIITTEPQYREIFRGFTYFRNALSSFPKTYTSVPSFLTAGVYDNTLPMEDFLEKTYRSSSSLPRLLMEKGFDVQLFPMPHTEKTIFFSPDLATNIKKRKSGGGMGQELGFLVDITLFRFVPHYAKRWVYNDQAWLLKRWWASAGLEEVAVADPGSGGISIRSRQDRLTNVPRFTKESLLWGDVQFIQKCVTLATVSDRAPAFRYYHLNGLHRPLVLTEDLQVRNMSTAQRSSFATQGKACLQIARLLIETIRVLGLFDNSMIVVMADHGCADYPYGVNLEAAGFDPSGNAGGVIPSHIKAAGLPMVLIKPFGAQDEELKISDAPVALTDLPRTVTTSLGLPEPMPGMSMFAVPELGARERQFYYYNWSGWVDGYLYHMRRYEVAGHSWLDASWRESGVLQPASAKKPYEWGRVIDFGPEGSGTQYQGIGWHEAQKDGFTWTREKRVELFLHVENPKGDLELTMTLKPFLVPGRLDRQEVSVWVGDRLIQTLGLTRRDMAEYKVVVPRAAVPENRLNLVFVIPTATAPVDLNIGADVRTLGFALKSLVIKQL